MDWASTVDRTKGKGGVVDQTSRDQLTCDMIYTDYELYRCYEVDREMVNYTVAI